MGISEANKKVLRSVWLFIKYAMLPGAYTYFVCNELLFPFFVEYKYLFFVMLAAIFNAVMSSVDNTPHFLKSRFRNFDPKIWCKEISWDRAPKIGSYKLDGWHIAQSLMIISFAFAIVNYNQYTWWIDIITIGYFFNITFSLFYDIILRKKNSLKATLQ